MDLREETVEGSMVMRGSPALCLGGHELSFMAIEFEKVGSRFLFSGGS